MSDLADWTQFVVHANREDGAVDLEQLTGENFTVEELARLYIEAEAWATAAGKVKAAIGRALLAVVDEPVEVDGWLVWKGEKKRTICVDPEGFSDWLGKNSEMIGKVINPTYIKIGSLPPVVRDTFYETELLGKVELKAASLQVLEDAKRKRST